MIEPTRPLMVLQEHDDRRLVFRFQSSRWALITLLVGAVFGVFAYIVASSSGMTWGMVVLALCVLLLLSKETCIGTSIERCLSPIFGKCPPSEGPSQVSEVRTGTSRWSRRTMTRFISSSVNSEPSLMTPQDNLPRASRT